MRKLSGTLAALVTGAWASSGFAAGPDVGQILAQKPAQPGVVCDTPEADSWAQCKLEVQKNPAGWILYDATGHMVRQFLDTDGDNVVDRWSFYQNGQEVYRDIDTNKNGKADQHRWYNTGGSRWGIDQNEDGVVDAWKMISAEEASAEAVAAFATRNFNRLRAVMVSENELRELGLDAAGLDRVRQAQGKSTQTFQAVASKVPAGIQWMQFDGHLPSAVPGSRIGANNDVIVYQNATIIAEASGQTVWLRAAEVVRVGDSWKLVDVPTLIEPNQPLESAGVLVPAQEPAAVAAAMPADPMVEDNEEVLKYVAMLRKHDESLPPDDNVRQLVSYHIKRAELCAYIGAKSREQKNREYWYRGCADSINAAVQTGEYEQGISTLNQYADQFAKVSWGKDLAAYYKYRAINSAYAVELAKPSADHAKAQEKFLGELKDFLKEYGESSDAADALWQLGNGNEFSGATDEAIAAYKELTSKFADNPVAQKAAGALRRLEGEGKPFQLAGNTLGGNGTLNTSQYRGKVLIVTYWATWCEPCKAAMPNLKKLREKYGSKGLEIVGVCLDTNKQAAEGFLRSQGYNWPQIYEEGSMESGPAVQYGIISLPYTMLVDAEGKILDRNVQYAELESLVEKALAKKIAAGDTNVR